MKVFETTLLTLLLSVGVVGVAHAGVSSNPSVASKSTAPDTSAATSATSATSANSANSATVSTTAPGDGAVKRFDFEDDQVEGDLQRPDGELITSIPKASQSSLIEIRRDFIPEIIKSLEDLD